MRKVKKLCVLAHAHSYPIQHSRPLEQLDKGAYSPNLTEGIINLYTLYRDVAHALDVEHPHEHGSRRLVK